jgi:hypothetical protein
VRIVGSLECFAHMPLERARTCSPIDTGDVSLSLKDGEDARAVLLAAEFDNRAVKPSGAVGRKPVVVGVLLVDSAPRHYQFCGLCRPLVSGNR